MSRLPPFRVDPTAVYSTAPHVSYHSSLPVSPLACFRPPPKNVLGWLKRGGCTELLARARELGVVSIRRAFGDFSNPTVASRQVELQRHGFDLVHTLHPAKGKSNSADISMTIDVMECCRCVEESSVGPRC